MYSVYSIHKYIVKKGIYYKGNRKIFLYFLQKKFYYAKIEGVK